MKNFAKRIGAVGLVVCMVMSMALTASAATYNLRITVTGPKPNADYEQTSVEVESASITDSAGLANQVQSLILSMIGEEKKANHQNHAVAGTACTKASCGLYQLWTVEMGGTTGGAGDTGLFDIGREAFSDETAWADWVNSTFGSSVTNTEEQQMIEWLASYDTKAGDLQSGKEYRLEYTSPEERLYTLKLTLTKRGGSVTPTPGGSSTPTPAPGDGTVTNPDGSTTTTTTDKTTGTVTETTTKTETTTDGTKVNTEVKTETAKDGTVTETATKTEIAKDGTQTETKTETKTETAKDGTVTETKTETKTETATDGAQTKVETETKTETAKDGSATETKVETKIETTADGTVTETKTETKTETATDGSKTETVKADNGVTATTKTDSAGNAAATEVVIPAEAVSESKTVTLPVAGKTELAVSVPETVSTVKVEIPVENVTPGTVAIVVKADGTEEVIKTTTMTEDGVAIKLEEGATLKVVDNGKDFADTENHWSENAVSYVTAREMFAGTGNGSTFSPEVHMTRAMLAQVIYNLEGAENHDHDHGFNDIDDNAWYSKAVNWAAKNGVVSGYGDGSYQPDKELTREEVAQIFFNYAKSKGYDVSHSAELDHFVDDHEVSDWAQTAKKWAVGAGLISGKGGNVLGAKHNATRAEGAQMFMNFCQNIAE